MLTLKRLTIWLLETSMESSLLAVVLVVLFGCDQHAYVRCIGVNFVWIGTMFFSTGYLVTTAIARVVLRGGKVWVCPMVPLFYSSSTSKS